MKDTPVFSRYQIFMIAILAIIQFTVVLDFMVLSPLGPFLMKDLNLPTSQFSLVVSSYAFSAFVSSIATAGFADKFDRKRLLVVFYSGFILGTLCCAMAPTYELLMAARIVTGLFGGVIISIAYAIISDLFSMETRGRVTGFVQMSFAASQILGIPLGLFLANTYNWHFPFYTIVGFSLLPVTCILIFMKPITAHLAANRDRNAFAHLWSTLSNKRYLRGFMATTLLATGGYMLMPFGSAFATKNMGISIDDLPLLYAITGVFSIVFGPIIGKLSDQYGKMRLFTIGTAISIFFVVTYTQLGITPLWLAILLNVLLFIGISSRMISATALMTAVPSPQDRGAFMSLNSAVSQLSGGISSTLAGMIVSNATDGHILHYPVLGLVVCCTMLIALALMFRLNKTIRSSAN